MMAGDVDIPSQGRQLMELHRENERLEAEVERLRALFRKVYDNLPPGSAYDNLAREIKRELR